MKAVRTFSVVMALTLFAVAIVPSAVKPIPAHSSQTILVTSPVQAFVDAASGMPLLVPMSVTAPLITLSVESAFSDYACKLVSQKPKNYTPMVPRQIFDMIWSVKNSGKHIWFANTIPVKYISGTKMQTYISEFFIKGQVGIGGRSTIVVDMTAPKAWGIYTTTWGLYAGKKPFCIITATVNVSLPSRK